MKTNNYVLTLVFFLLSMSVLWGQTIEFDNVSREGFKGLKKLDDNGYYLQLNEGLEGKGKAMVKNIRLYMLDNNLIKQNEFVIKIGRLDDIEDISYNGGNFMVIYGSKAKATRNFKIFDTQGGELAHKPFEKVKRRLLTKPAMIVPIAEKDFIVINFIKEKKIGYSIERFNEKLESQFVLEQIPDKKKLYPVDYLTQGDRLYVLEFLSPDASDYYEYHVASVDVNSGKEIYNQYIKSSSSKASGFATFIKADNSGNIFTGGMYFDGNRTKSANSDGFFAAKIDPSGNMTFKNVDWKEVKADVKDKGTAGIWGGKTKTFMQDLVVNDDGGLTLIGETYRRGDADLAGGKKALGMAGKMMGGGKSDPEVAVTISSFALFDFDKDLNFNAVTKMDKPVAVTTIKSDPDPENQPYVGQRKGLNLANILNNNGYFPYRFVIEKDGVKYLTYKMKYDPMVKELLYFSSLKGDGTDTVSVEVTSSEMKIIQDFQNKILSKLGGLGKLAKKSASISGSDKTNDFLLGGDDDPFDYRAKSQNTRMMEANVPGKVIIYDFVPEEGSTGNAATLRRSKGILKIWHIDVH